MASYLDNLNLYDASTLSRGRAYFKNGAVQEVKISGKDVDAVVVGSERYELHFHFDQNHKLLNASCSCPCQFPCKHQVAVLYKLDEMDLEKLSVNPQNNEDFSAQFKAAIRNRDAASFYRLGLVLLGKMTTLPLGDAQSLTAFFLGNFGLLSYSQHFGWNALAENLLFALPLSEGDKVDFVYALLTDPSTAPAQEGAMFEAFVDDGRLAKIYDASFVRLYEKKAYLAKVILERFSYHQWHSENLSSMMLLILFKEKCFLPNEIDLSERLPHLSETSSPEEISLFSAIIAYWADNHHLEKIPADAFASLKRLGRDQEAAELARNIFLAQKSLRAYQVYRSYLKEDEVADVVKNLESPYEKLRCRDAILLYESSSLELPRPKLVALSLEDIYLCAERVEPTLKNAVVETLDKKLSASLDLKRVDPDCAYGLLALKSMAQDDLLKKYLGDPRLVSKSLSSAFLRGKYLLLLVEEGLEQTAGYSSYEEAKHVSQ